jgi:disulfide oxidoreductase YuzD
MDSLAHQRLHKFDKLREGIDQILKEKLQDKSFEASKVDIWSNNLAEIVKQCAQKVLGGASSPYKLVCHVVLGENLGGHVRVCCKCVWDQERDKVVSAQFKNETIFCVATVLASFIY